MVAMADAGLPVTEEIGSVLQGTLWRPLAAVLAYPVLGRALLLTVRRYRLFKATDLLVEAALIGAAGALALQVVVNRWTSSGGWEPAAPVMASLLVGLDIALAVVVARPLNATAARRDPVVVVGASVTALLAIGGGCLYGSLSDRHATVPVRRRCSPGPTPPSSWSPSSPPTS